MPAFTLQPAPDRRVRKPDGTLLAAAGERIELNSFWQRRIDDGDVLIVLDAPVKAAKKGE